MQYDCLVLGSGPAGFYAAMGCAGKGYSTVIVENRHWGGTGFNDGCLPVKRALDRIKIYRRYGSIFGGDPFSNFPSAGAVLSAEGDFGRYTEERVLGRLKKAGVDTVFGDGEFISKNELRVSGRILSAGNVIIATGTAPSAPSGITIDGKKIITHREALVLDSLPEEMIILGGNVEGIEFASLFSSLGTKITVLEQESEVLPGNDRDLITPLIAGLKDRSVVFKTGTSVVSSCLEGDKVVLTDKSGKGLVAEKVLITGFRTPNIPRRLADTGVKFSESAIPVDRRLMTNVPGIYAAGDINGLHGMAHIAIQQGIFTADAIEGKEVPMDYSVLPRAIFTLPEIAGAGKQEWELKEAGVGYKTVKFDLVDTWRGLSKGIDSGFIKLIFDSRERLLGIWMTGESASEIMSASGLLLKKKVTKEDILENLFIHPTLGEGIVESVTSLL